MKPSANSRFEIRKRYEAACAKCSSGTAPPDIDSFLTACPEPERPALRTELESLRDSYSNKLREAGPNDPTLGKTIRKSPEKKGSTESPATGDATVDRAPPKPGGTLDFIPDDRPKKLKHNLPKEPSAVPGYEILGVLGRGAMGVVYKARQTGLNRIAALKMILSGGHASENELGRFRGEAEAVAKLHHPNIVQIYEVGEADGMPFFSLEFVDGVTLAKRVHDHPIAPKEAASICKSLAAAMEFAHKRGIIHRDLKPANILLTTDGVPKITDFGLAKQIEKEDAGMTRSGTILGTPSYMSPEQAQGKNDEVGPVSDVYSLGAILYDLLAGRAPFRGTTVVETLAQVCTREPVPPSQVQPNLPRDLETICLKCLQKDPARRYESAAELADDLDRFLNEEPILARPVGRVERAWRWCKRNPRIAALASSIAMLIVGWAVTSSILAVSLKHQRDVSDRNEAEAKKQETIANINEAEAKKQEKIAVSNEAEAKRQEKIAVGQTIVAKKNEASAKATADVTLGEMIRLGDAFHGELNSKRVSPAAEPELRAVRDRMMTSLRKSLKDVSKKIDLAGGTTFGEVGMWQKFGDLLVKLGQSEEAGGMYRQSYDQIKRIVDAKPDSDLARGNLGVMALRLGHVPLHLHGDAREARKHYKDAYDLHKEILTNPRDRSYKPLAIKVVVSHSAHHLGEALLALGDPAEAAKFFEESQTYRREWSVADPKSKEARSYLMQVAMSLAIAASHRGDEAAMEKQFRDALAIGDGLLRDTNFVPYRKDKADVLGAYGDALIRVGKTDVAHKTYQESLDLMRFVVKSRPDDLTNFPLFAQSMERLALTSERLKQAKEAEKLRNDALDLRAELLRVEPSSLSRQAAHLLALAHAGKSTEAVAEAIKLQPRFAKSTELQLQLARCWAVCGGLDSDDKANRLRRATDAIESATRSDFKAVFVLRTDPDLEPLRESEAFKAIVANLDSR